MFCPCSNSLLSFVMNYGNFILYHTYPPWLSLATSLPFGGTPFFNGSRRHGKINPSTDSFFSTLSWWHPSLDYKLYFCHVLNNRLTKYFADCQLRWWDNIWSTSSCNCRLVGLLGSSVPGPGLRAITSHLIKAPAGRRATVRSSKLSRNWLCCRLRVFIPMHTAY